MNLTLLKEIFAGFVRTRHVARHFRRLALLDSLTQTGVSREVPVQLTKTLVAAATADVDALLKQLDSHADGLSTAQAEAIRERVGLNEVEHEKPLPWWWHLWQCYKNPFNLLLTLLAVISYLTDDFKGATVIGTMVVLSTCLRFWQESKSNKAADELKAMVSNTATVIRRDVPGDAAPVFEPYAVAHLHIKPAQRVELPIKFLVPGDVVVLSAGDMIPADCRLLTAKDLFVAQAAMTGESMPVEKFAQQHDSLAINPLELDNILFMGTNVVSGAAMAVVLGTGNGTYFGALASRVTAIDRAPTSFQSGVNKVSWLLIRFMFVMSPLVLFINGFTKGDWTQADDRHLDFGQRCGVPVAQEGHRQAAGCNPEFRRDGRAVHRQDRHFDAGQDFPFKARRCMGRRF
jgi:Mg2+-importing ATPase